MPKVYPASRCLSPARAQKADARHGAGHDVPRRKDLLSSAAVARLLRVIGGGRGIVRNSRRKLLLDLGEILGLGLEVAGVRPLEIGFKRAAGLPIGVAEMIVDG